MTSPTGTSTPKATSLKLIKRSNSLMNGLADRYLNAKGDALPAARGLRPRGGGEDRPSRQGFASHRAAAGRPPCPQATIALFTKDGGSTLHEMQFVNN